MENVVYKRKFRWTIEATLPGGRIEPTFVRVNHRPNLNVEEIEIKAGSATTWIPGKTEWEAMTITIFDLPDAEQKGFWVAALPSMVPDPAEYPAQDKLGTFKLVLYDGCGNAMEEWELVDAFISALRFSDLDPSPEAVNDVEFTIRYKSAKYKQIYKQTYAHASMGMGIGSLGQKTKCPKCEHEFTTPGSCNIVF